MNDSESRLFAKAIESLEAIGKDMQRIADKLNAERRASSVQSNAGGKGQLKPSGSSSTESGISGDGQTAAFPGAPQ